MEGDERDGVVEQGLELCGRTVAEEGVGVFSLRDERGLDGESGGEE